MKKTKSQEHRLVFENEAGKTLRKGIPYHIASQAWDYGRLHALPLWTEYVIFPAVYSRDYQFQETRTTMSSFEMVLEGSMTMILDEVRRTVHSNEICLIPAGQSKKFEVHEECRKVVFGICGQIHLSLLGMFGIASRSVIRLRNPEYILGLLGDLYRLLREKEEATVSRISGLTMELITEIGREASRSPEPLLADAFRLMEYHLAESFSLSNLAEKLHVSPNYLNRLFLRELGMPPKRYLIGQRMQLARSLLNSTTLSVQEISLRCGYKTPFAFSKEFRKQFGISPRSFRIQKECKKMT